MSDALKTLQAAFRSKLQEAQAESDPKARATKIADLNEMKAAIEAEQQLGAIKLWADDATGETVPLVGGRMNAVTEQGSHEAGEDEGILTAPQLRAISTKAYKSAFWQYVRSGGVKDMSSAAIKTLQEGVDTGGGFLVPPDILNRIVAKEPAPTMVAGRVAQFQTSRDALQMPKVNYATDDIYTTGIRVTATGEVPSSSTIHRVTEPVFGQVRIPVATFMLSMPLTNDLIEDSAFDLVSYSSGKFSETVDLTKEDKILNGTGVGQPLGILANPGGSNQPAVVVSGSASALTWDGLNDVDFALPPQYEDNATWVANKGTLKAISKLKDGNSRPLWSEGLQDSGLAGGTRNKPLLTYPVLRSQFMPDVAASSYPMIFGDLKGYYLVNRVGFSIQVLREVYAELNQILLLGRLRFGGQVAEDWRLKIHQAHA